MDKAQEAKERVKDWAQYRQAHSQIARDCLLLLTELDAANEKAQFFKDHYESSEKLKNYAFEQLDAAKQENERLKVENSTLRKGSAICITDMQIAEQRLKKAIEALEWYADKDHYEMWEGQNIGLTNDATYESGERARQALSLIREEAGKDISF